MRDRSSRPLHSPRRTSSELIAQVIAWRRQLRPAYQIAQAKMCIRDSIITIDVVAEARRLGVGSALLRAAEEELLRSGAVVLALETPVNNEAAIRFYKRKGFFVEKTVAGYYSGQLDALVMTKELARLPVG